VEACFHPSKRGESEGYAAGRRANKSAGNTKNLGAMRLSIAEMVSRNPIFFEEESEGRGARFFENFHVANGIGKIEAGVA